MALKRVYKDVVSAVFFYLLYKIDSVTTLDVKNELRDLGYNAKQQEISDFIMEIFQDLEEVIFEANGENNILTYRIIDNHRVYEFFPRYINDDVCDGDCDCEDDNCCDDSGEGCCCKDPFNTNELIHPFEQVKDLMEEFPTLNSNELSEKMAQKGVFISTRSIAAIKANVTRKG